MAYKHIETYGVIGNLCTMALVNLDSSIDFFCFPNFDSPTLFAALLDEEKGGSFSIRPEEQSFECKQMYIAETNTLLTRFLSKDAVAELVDLMPVTVTTQKNEIIRTLQVIHGTVTFRLCCKPAFDYARVSHQAEMSDQAVRFVPDRSDTADVLLRATVPLEIDNGAAVATFTLKEGERAIFVLSGIQSEELPTPQPTAIDRDEVMRDCQETTTYWRSWLGKSTYAGRWREVVHRSALVLKLMTNRQYGSIVAAPTFGLPEHLGGQRNWDYRYTWVRDAAFTLYAFMRIGLREEADAFFAWLTGRVKGNASMDRPLQIMYGLDGRTDLAEIELDHLSGYKDSRPVRIGNEAFHQLQLDIYGEIFDSIYLYSKYGHALAFDGWEDVKRVLKWLGENWDRPDGGIWESRGGDRHLLHSRLMCWVAFDRAIRLAQRRSLSAPWDEWYRQRDAIANDIHANFWNEKINAFTRHKDTEALDASTLLMPLMRFISPLDPRWLSTLDAIDKSLGEDALVYRYRNDLSSDGLSGEEGSFTCCSFWMVECLARSGRIEEARRRFEKLLAHANHLGLFSEELGRDGHQLGNFPLALSHLALISAATYLDRALSKRSPEPWSS
ncbi:Glucoamylase [Acidisarcina polymorpha]|uniref:Glucoamylase n=1 Tax=Acidisarcina polymorpha TaxID=2211140 RepID=A0A2Z5FVM4_9BACT|nr:glycoside hydrolase family 15 protein [Acidisarcina polymorpha]AXC10557.1 Glucoamylase [Acidisarcina polymorpha]